MIIKDLVSHYYFSVDIFGEDKVYSKMSAAEWQREVSNNSNLFKIERLYFSDRTIRRFYLNDELWYEERVFKNE